MPKILKDVSEARQRRRSLAFEDAATTNSASAIGTGFGFAASLPMATPEQAAIHDCDDPHDNDIKIPTTSQMLRWIDDSLKDAANGRHFRNIVNHVSLNHPAYLISSSSLKKALDDGVSMGLFKKNHLDSKFYHASLYREQPEFQFLDFLSL
eukprot:GEZU01036335.1.p2 GENE.GEZU01036335.1~~GEZU01036335.1.p2  ORF type:complete len:152 (+),score=51.80 GEZU01036335.1:288-743(+)